MPFPLRKEQGEIFSKPQNQMHFKDKLPYHKGGAKYVQVCDSQTGVILCPRGYFFIAKTEGRVLLASSGWSPGMLLKPSSAQESPHHKGRSSLKCQ